MWANINYGSVVSHREFPFLDGGRSPKLLLILGSKPNRAKIYALTTSVAPEPPINPGCKAPRGLFLCQRHDRDCWNCDTYVLLSRTGMLLPEHVTTAEWGQHASLIGTLSTQTINAVKNCLLQSDDLSGTYRELLGN